MHWFRRHDRGRPPHPDVLTPAEWRVLERLREGLPNAEIAVRLGLSVNTVRVHVSNMLAKLELRDRRELAAWRGEPAEASRSALARFGLGSPFGWFGGPAGALARIAAVGGLALAGALVVWYGAGLASGGSTGNGTAVATPTPTEVAEATPEPDATPTPVVLVDGLPEGSVGPLLIYQSLVDEVSAGARTYPTFEVVVFDLGRGERRAAFEVGEANRYPLQRQVVGREILVNYEHELVVYRLDGTVDRVLYQASAGERIDSPSASHGGQYVALAVEHGNFAGSSLLIVDMQTGDLVVRLESSSDGLDGFRDGWQGIPHPAHWLPGDEAVQLVGVTYSSRPGSLGTMTLGGDFVDRGIVASRMMDPTGRYVAYGTEGLVNNCMFRASHDLRLHDLLANEDVVVAATSDAALTVYEWARDGSALLYASRAADEEGCEWTMNAPEWLEYDLASGTSRATSPLEFRHERDGDRAITFECAGQERRITQNCGDAPVTILVGGDPIDRLPHPGVLGFIETE